MASIGAVDPGLSKSTVREPQVLMCHHHKGGNGSARDMQGDHITYPIQN